MNIELGTLPSLIVAISILFAGYLLVARISVLDHYNIPVPVAGGILFAIVFALIYTQTPLRLAFNTDLRSFFMMAFFTTVGLGADLAQLRQGGKNLLRLLIVVVVFLAVQNAVGSGMAFLLDLHPVPRTAGGIDHPLGGTWHRGGLCGAFRGGAESARGHGADPGKRNLWPGDRGADRRPGSAVPDRPSPPGCCSGGGVDRTSGNGGR